MSKENPTIEEVREQLRESGFSEGEWKDRPEGKLNVPTKVKEIHSGMEKVVQILEMQVRQDQQTMARAIEELARLRHGGASAGRR